MKEDLPGFLISHLCNKLGRVFECREFRQVVHAIFRKCPARHIQICEYSECQQVLPWHIRQMPTGQPRAVNDDNMSASLPISNSIEQQYRTQRWASDSKLAKWPVPSSVASMASKSSLLSDVKAANCLNPVFVTLQLACKHVREERVAKIPPHDSLCSQAVQNPIHSDSRVWSMLLDVQHPHR